MQIVPGIRLNLSRSSPSFSFGARGLHYTIGGKGTRTTVGIPGSGLSWTSYHPYSSSSRSAARLGGGSPRPTPEPPSAAPARSFESAKIEQLVAGSTSELAPLLDAARKRFPWHLLVLAVAVAISVLAIGYDLQPVAVGALVFGLVAWTVMFVLDRRKRTTTLEYKLDNDQNQRFARLIDAFNDLVSCHRIWRVPLEWDQQDWKRNAGANVTIERKAINPRIGLPSLVKSNLKFASFPLGKQTIFFAPDAVLIVSRNSVAALRYDDCDIFASTARFIESDRAPTDAEVVGETWRYVNRDGGPDRRFSNNRKLPICKYGQIDLKSANGLNERLHCSRSDAATNFAARAIELRHSNTERVGLLGSASANPTHPIVHPVKDHAIDETVATAFAKESEYARTLALEHGRFWEFSLIQELIASRLSALKSECETLEKARLSAPTRRINSAEFIPWLGDEINAMASAISKMARCIKQDLINALGKPGVSGDAIQMLRTVDALFDACGPFLVFERNLSAVDPPNKLIFLKDAFGGITASIAGVLERLVEDWGRAVEGLRKGSHDFQINVVFTAPPSLRRLQRS
jgi:hypothetical protein